MRFAGLALAGLLATLVVPAAAAEVEGSSLVDNGSFEAPDVTSWQGTGGASLERVLRAPSFHGGHALTVTSSGDSGSGATTEAVLSTGAGAHVLTLAVRGTASSLETVVRAVVTDPATGDRTTSADVHLQPWWQTVAVSATTSGSPLRFAVEEVDGGGAWSAGDRYLLDAVEAGPTGPTQVTTSGRQLLVDGQPYAIHSYGYNPIPWGGPFPVPNAAGAATAWNYDSAQCQSDAQLMRASGVNTLRISHLDLYDAAAFACLDAFHAAGVGLFWLVNGPQTLQASQPEATEAFWLSLSTTVNAVKDHPSTLGYVIGNENGFGNAASQPGWFQMLDELARRTKQLDPVHVTTTSLASVQYYGHPAYSPSQPFCNAQGVCWDGVNPELAPNVDLWGVNQYTYPAGWEQRAIDTDPTRPLWITEFGRRRYVCQTHDQPEATLGLDNVSCSVSRGSREDVAFQSAWLDDTWAHIGANLSIEDPDGAVVGGSLHMWSDIWSFAFCPFSGCGTQFTHEVYPSSFNAPVEWFGTSHVALPYDSGPRVTTGSFDLMARHYTGLAGPAVTEGPTVSDVGPCTARVTWATDMPTYGRVDYGLDQKVVVGDAIHSENFVATHHVQRADAATVHTVELTGLVPGSPYRVHARGFDELGRPASASGVTFTTPIGGCGDAHG